MRARPQARLLGLAAASAAAGALCGWGLPRGLYRLPIDLYADAGQALWHGVPLPDVSRIMPLFNTLCAAASWHAPAWIAKGFPAAVWLLSAGLALCCGAELHSPWAAVPALFVLGSANAEAQFFTVTLLLTGAALAAHARRPTMACAAGVGAAIAVSLLVRSELFAFPALLALYWAWSPKRPPLVQLALAVTLPYLVMLPWWALNWRLLHRFVPFEAGRAGTGLVAAALGLVQAPDVDYVRLAGLPPGASALAWAARETLRHPLRSAAAVSLRLLFLARLAPAAVGLAAFGAWRLREREDARRLALLAGYFAAAHAFFPADARYLQPLLPLLAVLGWAGVCSLVQSRVESWAWARRAQLVALTLISGAAAATLALAAVYPGRAARPNAVDAELMRHPDDPWLLWRRGRAELLAGQLAAAQADLSRAAAGRPEGRAALDLALAQAVSGIDPPGLTALEASAVDVGVPLQARLLRVLSAAEAGRIKEAAALWRAADDYRAAAVLPTGIRDPAPDSELGRAIRSDALLMEASLQALLQYWPPRRRAQCLSRLAEVWRLPGALAGPKALSEWLAWAGRERVLAYVEAKDAPAALAALGQSPAEERRALFEQVYSLAFELQARRDFPAALRLIDEAVFRYPREARFWNDRAVLRAAMGQPAAALADARRATTLDPDFLPALVTLGALYESLGRAKEARALYDAALSRPAPADYAELWSQLQRDRAALR